MKRRPPKKIPSLAERRLDLLSLALPGALLSFQAGQGLLYHFSLAPSVFGRVYDCRLHIKPDARMPEVLVLAPDLKALANGDDLPHIYPHDGPGTKLCLWWPRQRDWLPQMKLTETCIPWTAEWLWYFEDWLSTRFWTGGGEHPQPRSKRYGRIKSRSAIL